MDVSRLVIPEVRGIACFEWNNTILNTRFSAKKVRFCEFFTWDNAFDISLLLLALNRVETSLNHTTCSNLSIHFFKMRI